MDLPMPSAPTKPKPKVAVASTGKDAERFLKLAIATSKPKPKVVMSLPRSGAAHATLPALRPGDRLLVSAELEVTTDCPQQQSDCAGKPYGFDPEVEVSLLLANRAGVAVPSAGTALALGQPQRRRVIQERHHDVFVFDNVAFTVPLAGLPWSGPSFVSAAIAAWHPQAKQGQVLIVGQNNPGGTPGGDMGAISVARFRPGTQTPPNPLRVQKRQITTLPLITGQPQKGIVYSQRLDDLEAGEQLRVRAGLKTSTAHLGYPARTTAEVMLSAGPGQTDPGAEAKRVCPESPQISRGNGKNTLPTDAPMSSLKTGVMRIVKDARVPLYVNVMLTDGDPEHEANPGDEMSIVPGGFLAVTRYPAALAG
jgi:hypothetical protein